MKICLLGAESTGKTSLCAQLTERLRAQGHAVHAVPERLRDWCTQHGRTPLAHEQADIAAAQTAQTLAAPAGHWVLADTSALMTAVYSELLFGDTSLYAMALAHQRHYDLSLLMGLDLPWVADGMMRDGPQVRAPVDRLIRAALESAGLPYQVVYGSGAQRLDNAWLALQTPTARTRNPALSQGRWQGVCEKCSDPDCEHRLFRRLLEQAAGPAGDTGPKPQPS